MKNINSNWLGTPPEHWKALKLRQILRPFSEKNHADLQLLSVVREVVFIIRVKLILSKSILFQNQGKAEIMRLHMEFFLATHLDLIPQV